MAEHEQQKEKPEEATDTIPPENPTSQIDWPSEDDEDDDYNPEKLMQNGSARENGISDDENSDSDSDSSTGSDSNSTGSSEVVFFDEFAGKSRGKKR